MIDVDWAPTVNTFLLIVLALLNYFFHRRGKTERNVIAKELREDKVQVSQQLSHIAEAVADTRRVQKESHNDLVEVAREATEKVLRRRYEDKPGEDHTYKRRKEDQE